MRLDYELYANESKTPIYLMICDGDPEYLEMMQTHVEKLRDKFERELLVDMFSDANKLLDCIRRRRKNKQQMPDIVFSDIRMEQMDGITFGRQLRKLVPGACLVFATAYAEHAIEGYEVNAFRYLIKPVNQNQIMQIIRDYFKSQIDSCKWIVKSPGKEMVIELQDIIYMSAEDKYTIIHTVDGDYLDRNSLNILESTLMEFGFYRVHRKYLINMRHHKSFGKREILLTDDVQLPMSRRREKQYQETIGERRKKGYM